MFLFCFVLFLFLSLTSIMKAAGPAKAQITPFCIFNQQLQTKTILRLRFFFEYSYHGFETLKHEGPTDQRYTDWHWHS